MLSEKIAITVGYLKVITNEIKNSHVIASALGKNYFRTQNDKPVILC